MMEDLFARLVTVLERDWPSLYDDWVRIQELLERRMAEIIDEVQVSMMPFRQCYPDPGMCNLLLAVVSDL